MKRLLVCLALAGCTTAPQVLTSNSSAVTIRHGGSYPEAAALAQQRCAAYDKDVRLVHTEGWLMSFDCVAR